MGQYSMKILLILVNGYGPPLYGEDADYDDGHANDIYSEAQDVAALMGRRTKNDGSKTQVCWSFVFGTFVRSTLFN